MAELYEVDRSVISKHLKNIYTSGESDENTTCADFAQVQKEGERSITRTVPMYFEISKIVDDYMGASHKLIQAQRSERDRYLLLGFQSVVPKV